MRDAILLVFLASILSASAAAADNAAQQPSPATLGESKANNCAALFYPPAAISADEEGAVTLSVQIDDTGKVTAANVTQSSGFSDLDQAGITCVMSGWRFHPATLEGKPVASSKMYRIIWLLSPEPLWNSLPCHRSPTSSKGGIAVVAYHVRPDGRVESPFIMQSSNDNSFDGWAVQCASQLSYKPAPVLDGKPWGGTFVDAGTGVSFADGRGLEYHCDEALTSTEILRSSVDYAATISFEAASRVPPTNITVEHSSGDQQFDNAALKCVGGWNNILLDSNALVHLHVKIASHQGHMYAFLYRGLDN